MLYPPISFETYTAVLHTAAVHLRPMRKLLQGWLVPYESLDSWRILSFPAFSTRVRLEVREQQTSVGSQTSARPATPQPCLIDIRGTSKHGHKTTCLEPWAKPLLAKPPGRTCWRPQRLVENDGRKAWPRTTTSEKNAVGRWSQNSAPFAGPRLTGFIRTYLGMGLMSAKLRAH